MATNEAKCDEAKLKPHAAVEQSKTAPDPDEERMSEIAKRLLSTPPDRQAVGKTLAPKRKADKAKGS